MTVLVPPQALTEELIAFRRELHRNPELSLQEYETTQRIRSFLQAHGIQILDLPLKTGLVARVEGQHPGPCVAVRADIDALPIREETGLPFASTVEGKMHACGHDFHTSGVLGTAVLAKQLADGPESFAGSLLFVFQPAEEMGEGANQIVNTGVFQQFDVKAIIGEHNQPFLETGKIGVRTGPLMGSVDEFKILVKGVGGHAALPHATVDPIVIGANIVTGLQHVVSRSISPLDSVVVTVGQFHAGTARNIIPMEAVIEGTVRSLQPRARDTARERILAFVEETARAYGGQAQVEYIQLLPAVVNEPRVTSVVAQAAAKVVGEQNVVEAEPTLGGEDFSLYQKSLPGCFFWVGTAKQDGSSKAWHHPAFDVDEQMISTTSAVFMQAALDLLNEYR